jgi:hypothetical protein
MIVATAIMAVLAGSLYATLRTAFQARRSATTAVEETRRADIALAFLQADLASAVVPRGILAGGFLGEPSTDAAGQPADALLLHVAAPGGETVAGVGDLRMIEFACEPADNGTGLVLVRYVTTNLLAPTTPEPEAEVLCRGVFSFAVRYYDGIDWLETWDSTTQDNQLPAAVEVVLELRDPDDPERDEAVYRAARIVRIPASAVQAGGMEVPLE